MIPQNITPAKRKASADAQIEIEMTDDEDEEDSQMFDADWPGPKVFVPLQM